MSTDTKFITNEGEKNLRERFRVLIKSTDQICYILVYNIGNGSNLDAYQYVAAEKQNLTIISFDKNFDKTKQGRKTPAEALKQ